MGTGLVLLLAVGLLVHDRLLPELRRAGEVEVGEAVPEALAYQNLASHRLEGPVAPGPAIHLVFQSGCPACGRNLPRWEEILSARPEVRSYAVGIEPPEPGLRYARRHLPTAIPVRPTEEREYLRRLRIHAVPATLVVDGAGRLVWRGLGVLGSADVEEILGQLPSRGPASRTSSVPSTPTEGESDP